MFYWRQKKCFSMIDKVKNVTTLIIYSSAWQKKKKKISSKAKNHLHHSSDAMEKKKALSDSPFSLMGQSAHFQFSDKVMLFM